MGHPPVGGQVEHGACEDRALRNDPVGHFSEGASLQGRHGASASGRTSGAWGIRQWADKWGMEQKEHLAHK